jgi:hypothetical protein
VVDIKAATNGLNLAVDGNILDTPDFAGSELRLNFHGPLLSTITEALDIDDGPDAPFTVDVLVERITGGADIRDGQVTLGDDAEYTLSLEGTVTEQADLLGSHLRLQVQGPSLAEISAAAGIDAIPDLPFSADASVAVVEDGYALKPVNVGIGQDRATVTGIVGADPLAGNTDVDFEVILPDLKHTLTAVGVAADNLPGGDLEAAGSVSTNEGRIRLQEIVARLADTTAKVEGELGELPGLEGSAIQLDIAGDDLAALLPLETAGDGLANSFTLVAGIQVKEQTLLIESARFALDRTVIRADTRFKLEPMLDSGQFSLQGNSPDILPFFPQPAEISSGDTVPFDLAAKGHWADNLWTVEQIELKLAAADLQVKGSVDGPPDFDKTNLRLTSQVRSLQPFSKIAGRPLPDEPGNISLHLVGEDDVITLETFEGRLGDSDFEGDFSLRDGDVPDISLALTSKRLNLKPFLPPEPEVRTDAPVEPKPPKDKKRKLIPDTPLPMDELQKLQARVNVRVDELILRAQTLKDVVLVGSIEQGELFVSDASFKGERGGALDASLSLRPEAGGGVLRANINGNKLTVGLPANSPQELKDLPRYQLNMALIGRGETVREMAGGTNGYLRVVAGKGSVRAGAARALTNDFIYQLVSMVNPYQTKDPYTQVNCALVLASVEGGKLEGKPILVLQSERVNVFADVDIDLRSEQLKATFNTVPQKGLGIGLTNLASPYVAVVGTLGYPQITMDAESTIVHGGAAVATLGLSVVALAMKDRFLSSDTPCEDEIKKADKDLQILETKYGQPGRKTGGRVKR